MKKTIKFAASIAAIVLVSSGVASVSTYSLMKRTDATHSSFQDEFETAPAIAAGLDGLSSLQPVDLTKAAESSLNSVVHIISVQRSKVQTIQAQPDIFDFFFGNGGGNRQQQVRTPEQKGFGSGVIISKDGYIATNNHVIDGADEIIVKLQDSRELKGRIIGTDPTTDLALVKIEGDDFPAIPIGNSDNLKVGEWVLAVGNPFNLGSTVTAGVVSAKARSIGGNQVESFIQTDAAINRGNSGGALVNAKGELVGINAMLVSPTGTYSGYGFAIPTSIMTKVVTDLKKYGTVQRAMLGITGRPIGEETYPEEIRKEQKELGTNEGVEILEITEGSSVDGILQKKDVIKAIGDVKVKSMGDLQGALAQYRPGDKVNIKVWRNKAEKSFNITLKNAQGNTKVVKNADMELLGAAFRPVSAETKKQLNLGYGIEVTGLNQGRMSDSGIRKGFIILKANGTQLRTVQDLEQIMKQASQSPDQVLFLTGIYPSGKRANYAVDLTQE
ncbi:trypsin-like peptidase domain-containing protein [Bacteroides heparinolyticus]|uniref:trypsin-like peptidase domain-containing protein n=2 Tax=Prevotella heparinolytica TaxID=28113 RepID=UPI0035A180C1